MRGANEEAPKMGKKKKKSVQPSPEVLLIKKSRSQSCAEYNKTSRAKIALAKTNRSKTQKLIYDILPDCKKKNELQQQLVKMIVKVFQHKQTTLQNAENQGITNLLSRIKLMLALGITHDIIFSLEFQQFIFHNLYQLSQINRQLLLHIVQYIAVRPQNRQQIFLFFQKELEDKKWDELDSLERRNSQIREFVSVKQPGIIDKSTSMFIKKARDLQKFNPFQPPAFAIERQKRRQTQKKSQLQKKANFYLHQSFIGMVLHITKQQEDQISYQVLLNLIQAVYFKCNRIQLTQNLLLLQALDILRKGLPFVWQKREIHKIMELVERPIDDIYKTLLCDILVQNCDNFGKNVEQVLDQCLIKIYRTKNPVFHYCLLNNMARKFDKVCQFLNNRRVVGRIMDLTLAGIIDKRSRKDLKKLTSVPFEDDRASLKKQTLNISYVHHKWELLNFILEQVEITDVQKREFVFLKDRKVFQTILQNNFTKATLNNISKFFAFLCRNRPQYLDNLGKYLRQMLFLDYPFYFHGYLRVLKQIVSIRDDHTIKRCITIAHIFCDVLEKHYKDDNRTACQYTWQWLLKIGNRSSCFRDCLRKMSQRFEFVVLFSVFGQKSLINFKRFKKDTSKNIFYGLIFPNSLEECEPFHVKKTDRTSLLLSDEDFEEEDQGWNSDSDLSPQTIQRDLKRYMKQQLSGYAAVNMFLDTTLSLFIGIWVTQQYIHAYIASPPILKCYLPKSPTVVLASSRNQDSQQYRVQGDPRKRA